MTKTILHFQGFLEDKNPGPNARSKYSLLTPVYSVPIFDAKAKKELQMMDISSTSSPAAGGKKIIILCEKVTREDIKVRFFDMDPACTWEAWGAFTAADVHKQYALSLTLKEMDL